MTVSSASLKYFPRENKILPIVSERAARISVRIFRIGKGPDAVRDFGLVVGPTKLPFLDSVFRNKYDCVEEFFFEETLDAGQNEIFLPIVQSGLYAVALSSRDEWISLLFLVSDIEMAVKRDKTRTAVFVMNRETGAAVAGADLFFLLPDRRHRIPSTDEEGLCFLPEGVIRYADRIVAALSNAIDFVETPARTQPEDPEFRILSVPDRSPSFRNGDFSVTTFLFRKDIYREYTAVPSFSYKLVWDGLTNSVEARDGMGRVEIPSVGSGFLPGLRPLLTIVNGQIREDAVPVVSGDHRKIVVDMRVPSGIRRGERLRMDVGLKNYGFRNLASAGMEWSVESGAEKLSGRKRRGRRRYRFWISTKDFGTGQGFLRVGVALRLPDGTRLLAERMVSFYEDTESASLELERRIFLPREPVKMGLTLESRRSPFISVPAVLEIREASERRIIRRERFLRRPGRTNILFYPDKEGLFEIRLLSGRKGHIEQKDKVWIIPEKGDLTFPEDEGGFFHITTDKDDYNYGDIARVLMVSRRKKQDAFFSFEGDALFDLRLIRFENNYAVLDLPVTEANRPNAFLALQTVFSNRFYQSIRRIGVPPRHKSIYYHFRVNPGRFGRDLILSTKNVWNRAIRVFSFIRIGAGISSLWQPFGSFYQDIENRVSSLGRPAQEAEEGRAGLEPATATGLFNPSGRDLYAEEDGGLVFFFPDTAVSNTMTIRDDMFPHDRGPEILCRSVSRDAKTGFFRNRFELNNLVSFRFLIPGLFDADDRPAAAIGLKNMTSFERPVRILLHFIRDDVILYRTNRLVLKPSEERSVAIPFPREIMQPGRTKLTIECLTPESVLTRDFLTEVGEVRVLPEGRAVVSKRIRRIGFFSRPDWPGAYKCEESARVFLRVRGTLSDGLIRDEVPAGFRPIIWSVEEAGGRTDGRFVWFPAGEERITYLMRAVTPGEYGIPAAVVTGEEDFVSVEGRGRLSIGL